MSAALARTGRLAKRVPPFGRLSFSEGDLPSNVLLTWKDRLLKVQINYAGVNIYFYYLLDSKLMKE